MKGYLIDIEDHDDKNFRKKNNNLKKKVLREDSSSLSVHQHLMS